MATLEKIRSKSVLLFVIIIVALLAFILGDFLTSGRTYFGNGTTIASAGKAKVDYTEYQNAVNEASEQNRNQQQTPDNDELSQQVLQQLLLEKLQKNEYAELGIVVTDGELSQALTGEVPHPAAQQFIYGMSQQLQLPVPSGQAVYDAMMNPTKYGFPAEAGQQLRQYWVMLEKQVEAAMLQEKFDRLVNGLFTANALDAKHAYDDVVNVRDIRFVAVPIGSVSDDDVEVTDADLREVYNDHRNLYKINEPVRAIDYIMVRIEPSDADRLAGTKEVEDALATLNSEEGTATVAANSRFVVTNASATAARINDKRLKEFVDTAAVGQATLLNNIGDRYTLVKLLGKKVEVDSINVSMLGAADAAQLDSLYAAVNAGTTFAAAIADGTPGQDSIWTSLAVAGIPEKVKEALETRAVGSVFALTDTVQGQPANTIYRINSRRNPVAVYDIATIEYTVDPSQETLAQLSGDLNTYVSNNSSAADFAANAAEAGYTVMSGAVSNSTPHVGTATDSRPVVKWIMKAKKGNVMPVYQDNKQTYLLAVAVTEVNDGEYLPYNSRLIADDLRAEALKNKKAAKIIGQYEGKASDIDGYAKAMGAEPQQARVIFSSPMITGLGFGESEIAGAIGAAAKGEVSGPMQGNNSVVVFVVDGEETEGREFSFEEYASQFNRQLGIGGSRPIQDYQRFMLLLGDQNVKNHSLDYIQGFGE